MSVGIHKWLSVLGFDPGAADSNRTAGIVGIPVASVSAESGFAV